MQYDKEFLLKLDKSKNKIIYARIESLQIDESPVETIEGRVTQGSINIDGTSAVRRSCSLTLIAQNYNYKDYYWGLKTKFRLFIGLENNIDSSYPKIIWFNQGIFLITSLNTSHSASNFTMSISGKDKMCLLNGELGGSFNSSIDFGTIETEQSNGVITIEKIPIPDIIRNMIHQYANEPYHNIIINDLDMLGLELLEYRYDTPMYLYRLADSYVYENATLDGSIKCIIDGNTKEITLDELTTEELDMLVSPLSGSSEPKKIIIENKAYYVAKIEYGQTAGYRTTELVYAGDLIANIGDSITSILDKIKKMLGEFEYFYDIYGRFVFQKKASLVNTFWTPENNVDDENEIKESLAAASIYAYTFNQGELITAFNNNPNLSNLKNDYSVWGTRTSVSGADIPVHMRYAIDKKPTYYKNFQGQVFMTDKETVERLKEEKKQSILQNIKERINNFEMSYEIPSQLNKPSKKSDGSWTPGWWDIRDWYKYYMTLTLEEPRYSMKWYSQKNLTGCIPANSLDIEYTSSLGNNSYVWLLIKNTNGKYNAQHGSGNPETGGRDCVKWEAYYDTNGNLVSQKTNPEEIQYFPRPYSDCSDSHTYLHFLINDVEKGGNSVYFYNPSLPTLDSFEEILESQIQKEFNEKELNYVDWREIIYQMALDFYQDNNKSDNFEITLQKNNEEYYPTGQTGYEQYYTDLQGFWRELYNPYANEEDSNFYPKEHIHAYWNRNVYEHPELLNFWFDFLDTEGELSQFSVKNVGVRAKPINDNNVKSIYFRETPSVIYGGENLTENFTAYKWIHVKDESIDSMFSISSQGLSAKDKLDELIYQHGYCIESATITTVPIYYLQPNTRIYLFDEKANLEGDYIISKISIPLSYNGTMSITATKAANNII